MERWVGRCATNRGVTALERAQDHYEFVSGLPESDRVLMGYAPTNQPLGQTDSRTAYLEREARAGRAAVLRRVGSR